MVTKYYVFHDNVLALTPIKQIKLIRGYVKNRNSSSFHQYLLALYKCNCQFQQPQSFNKINILRSLVKQKPCFLVSPIRKSKKKKKSPLIFLVKHASKEWTNNQSAQISEQRVTYLQIQRFILPYTNKHA